MRNAIGVFFLSITLGLLSLMSPALAQSTRLVRDAARNNVWVLQPDALYLHDAATRALKKRIELPGWLWVGEPYGCGPALVLGPAGEAVVTSDVAPTLWRVDPRSLQVSVHALALSHDADKDVGFSTLAYSSEQGAFIAVSGTQGSLWRIDARLTRAERIGSPDGRTARMHAQARAPMCTTRFVGFSLDN
jgi:hypothetical protein